LVVYHFAAASGPSPGAVNQRAAEVGRGLWMWGCIGQAILLPLVVPAFTCGAITLERERDMLELLLLTRQTPFQICSGKLMSGAGLGMVLVLASVPVLSLSLFLGGVAPYEIGACVCVLVTAVLAAAALGLAASSVAPRTQSASAACYAIVGFSLIGFPLLMTLLREVYSYSAVNFELGIALMLAACIVISFVPGIALAAILHAARRRRTTEPATRAWWLLTGGLCWCGILAFLYLPGMTALLLEGSLLVALHPVMVIGELMSNRGAGPGTPIVLTDPHYRWVLTSLLSLLLTAWSFQIAVLRVRRLRVG
ncbi:MAG: hypothetical protein K0Q72_2814, partial [Armatimonadetes bacterium]|nr:hypothetical protein [Armatimonadota bacterium]